MGLSVVNRLESLKGKQGNPGPQGPKGADGAKGAPGPAGATGPQGPPGQQGIQGVPGPQGPAGQRGETGPRGLTGERGLRGEVGPHGPANVLRIGSVTKGEDASATITGSAPNQTLNLVLPKGDPGASSYIPLTYLDMQSAMQGNGDVIPRTVSTTHLKLILENCLPKASDTQAGVIKIGNNLEITEDGVLSAKGGVNAKVLENTTSMSNAPATNDTGMYLVKQTSPISDLINIFYPVGTYYETSDTSFDPNASWGGTWVLDTDGTVLASKSNTQGSLLNQSVGTVVGAEKHTLTIDEMPSHNHDTGKDYNSSRWYVRYTESEAGFGSYQGPTPHQMIVTRNVESQGGGQAHNIVQTTKIINRWHRTA